MNVKHYVTSGVILAGVFAVSACNSTNNSSPAAPGVPTAVPIPAASPFSSSVSVQSAPAVAAAVMEPSVAGYSGTADFSFPSVLPPGTTITTSVSNIAPSNVPQLSSILRKALSLRPLSAHGKVVVLTYNDFLFNNAVTYLTPPSFVFTIPSADIVPAAYYLALYDPTVPQLSWQLGFEGPATISGSTLTFSSTSVSTFTFAANADYFFALYAISLSAAKPTPAPSAVPTTPATATPVPNTSQTPTPTASPTASSTPGSQPTSGSQPTPGSQPT